MTVRRRINDALARRLGIVVLPAARAGVAINDEWVHRFLYFDRLLDRVDGVAGDVAECGVAGGQSLAMLASLVRARATPRHVLGFDSWEGLPDPRPEDLTTRGAAAERGLFAWAAPEVVARELRGHGLDEDAVTLTRGPFAETLPSVRRALALVHVDADLYESYRDVLTHLWPRVVTGGIVAFDEYDLDDLWPGPRRAVDEFLATADAELHSDDRIGKYYARKTG